MSNAPILDTTAPIDILPARIETATFALG